MPAVPVTREPLALTETSVLLVIPARYQSTRLPGKPLLDIGGHPMIEHVYRRAAAASSVDGVLVATDDARIAARVAAFGGHAWMTAPHHRTGTDRLAEVAARVPCDVIVNVQGDEPLIEPDAIDLALAPMLTSHAIPMSTLCRTLHAGESASPHVVKVVTDRQGFALYFSRAAIPFNRERGGEAHPSARAHIGIYVYRRRALMELAALPASPLERAEGLEQLRALENGIRIKVQETTFNSVGVDTPEDLDRVRRLVADAGVPDGDEQDRRRR